MKRFLVGLMVAAVGAIGFGSVIGVNPALASTSSSGGSGAAVYNAIPSKLPGNVVSTGFECCATSEFGDEVGLGGTARTLNSMSVVMSSWGCQSGHWNTGDCVTAPGATFPVPLTFTIYADNNGTPGAVLARQTQTVDFLFRPSADPICTGGDAGKWFDSKDHTCYNGLAQTIEMTFSVRPTLPSQVIWSVAFNTTTYGAIPILSAPCNTSAGGCGYDSLNVGTQSFPNAPYAGTDLNEDLAFRNGTMQSGWTGFRPLGRIGATTK